jgi:hypothetical protein
VLALLFALSPVSVFLDGISVERARTIHGRLVSATFLVAKPGYLWRERTVIGAADREDGAERGAMLCGSSLDLDVGKRVTVVGVLLVIDHGPYVVNRVAVPTWPEIRVEAVK